MRTEANVDWKERCKAVQRNCNKHIGDQRHAQAECKRAEQACRDITRDRDRWKQRYFELEAAFVAIGGQFDFSVTPIDDGSKRVMR